WPCHFTSNGIRSRRIWSSVAITVASRPSFAIRVSSHLTALHPSPPIAAQRSRYSPSVSGHSFPSSSFRVILDSQTSSCATSGESPPRKVFRRGAAPSSIASQQRLEVSAANTNDTPRAMLVELALADPPAYRAHRNPGEVRCSTRGQLLVDAL